MQLARVFLVHAYTSVRLVLANETPPFSLITMHIRSPVACKPGHVVGHGTKGAKVVSLRSRLL